MTVHDAVEAITANPSLPQPVRQMVYDSIMLVVQEAYEQGYQHGKDGISPALSFCRTNGDAAR